MKLSFKDLYVQTSELIKKSESIMIISHINPDGDSVGASLALYKYLFLKGNTVSIAVPSEIPAFLKWLEGSEELIVGEFDKEKAISKLQNADLIFCVDFNSTERTGVLSEALKSSAAIKIMIDHHPDPVRSEFHCIISTVETSSTSELVYDFIVSMGDKFLINKAMAECIYAGIITDTGSLSYSCNYVSTYHILAELLDLGIDGAEIHNRVYNTYTEDRLRLLGHCLNDRLVVMHEFNAAFIYLTKEDLNRFNYKVGDTEDVVNMPLSIKGINLSAFFTERDGYIRISLRSKGDFSVNDFVRKYFSGGGHKNAAGANSYLSMQESIAVFRSAVEENKTRIMASTG